MISLASIRRAVSGSLRLKLLLIGLGILLVVLYIRLVQVPGIRFDSVFLAKTGDASEVHYRGWSLEGKFHITVKGEKNKDSAATVLYELPNRIKRSYTIDFNRAQNWENSDITLTNDAGYVIFMGKYDRYSPLLINPSGEPEFGEMRVSYNNQTYVPGYEPNMKETVDLAARTNETIRGSWALIFLALLIFAAVGLDMAFPLFYFTLSYGLWVENAEPSDAYLFMQWLWWIVMPIGGLVLLVMAVW